MNYANPIDTVRIPIESQQPGALFCSGSLFGLFDRYGRVQRDYINHEVRKGSVVWGTELDRGDLLVIESIVVQQAWRRKGLATKLLTTVLEKTRQKIHSSVPLLVICRPGWLQSEVRKEAGVGMDCDEKKVDRVSRLHQEASELFWRSLNFRRVGASAWFAFTDSTEHLSRQLEANDGYNPPQGLKVTMDPSWTSIFDGVQNIPVSESDFIAQMQAALEFVPDTDVVTDRYGNTILHIAAVKFRPALLAHILTKLPQLVEHRNLEGLLPVDVLRAKLEKQRTILDHGMITLDLSACFSSFSRSLLIDIEYLDIPIGGY